MTGGVICGSLAGRRGGENPLGRSPTGEACGLGAGGKRPPLRRLPMSPTPEPGADMPLPAGAGRRRGRDPRHFLVFLRRGPMVFDVET
ncbi:hypothetical protein EYF80_042315 [Liparis tanakae]|uniref:Uncharacterized protein n=1 Tax=Liparis tanakae TaxID=230148 RepID=A0A4Z2G3P8_9TELE|nr:hypothetical protein EYF80_042315 [Liparis tanakae]